VSSVLLSKCVSFCLTTVTRGDNVILVTGSVLPCALAAHLSGLARYVAVCSMLLLSNCCSICVVSFKFFILYVLKKCLMGDLITFFCNGPGLSVDKYKKCYTLYYVIGNFGLF
jgi:hypothetical protein